MAQTPAHAPTTDARRVSIISTGMDIELEDSAFGESLEQKERYNPFQGNDGLEGCSLTGLGSALSGQKTLVVHSSQKLMLRFHLLNLFCINMHGNQGLNSVTDYDVSKTKSFVGSFTKYLWFLFLFRERSLSLAALKVHRSAIATIVDPLSRTLLRQHHMVRRFMETLFLSRPLCRIVTFTWRMRSCSRFRQTQVL